MSYPVHKGRIGYAWSHVPSGGGWVSQVSSQGEGGLKALVYQRDGIPHPVLILLVTTEAGSTHPTYCECIPCC